MDTESNSAAELAERVGHDTTEETGIDESSGGLLDDPKSSELSGEFVGRWSTLVSTTNWEKGKIIFEWREVLQGSEAVSSTISDEAWSCRVGGVTAQHVGRLRRVYDRFSSTYESFPSLYWSHFLAALDWDDAEMWLEGAVRTKWSVSQMRRTRWESTGADPALKPSGSELVSHADDEDFSPPSDADTDTKVDANSNARDKSRTASEGPRPDGPDFGDDGDDRDVASSSSSIEDDDDLPWDEDPQSQESPFAKLPSLPADVAEALEQFKLAIIRHRADNWADVDQADVIKSLDALKSFAAL